MIRRSSGDPIGDGLGAFDREVACDRVRHDSERWSSVPMSSGKVCQVNASRSNSSLPARSAGTAHVESGELPPLLARPAAA